MDFGTAAMSPIDRLQIHWFDTILKSRNEHALAAQKPVCLFEMGRNQWRQLSEWPTPTVKRYYLQSPGLAYIREDSGELGRRWTVEEMC